MYGDPGAGLVDVVVLDPRHGLQTDGYRLAGQSLQLAHLEQSEVRYFPNTSSFSDAKKLKFPPNASKITITCYFSSRKYVLDS